MVQSGQRRWWIGLLVLGAVAGAAALLFRARPTPVAEVSVPEPPPAGPPAFEHWLEFETLPEPQRAAVGDLFIDAMLGHQVFRIPPAGAPRQVAQGLLLDDDELLLSSGRRLWTRELANQPGFAGQICYLHSTYCLKRLFDVSFAIDDAPAILYDNQYAIQRFPSHTAIRYIFPTLAIDEAKFITADDRAVAAYTAFSQDGKPHRLTVEIVAPYPPVPNASAGPHYPLLGAGTFQRLPLFLYLDAPAFERVNANTVHLRRTLDVPATGTSPSATVAFRFDNIQREQPATPLDRDPARTHARAYNRWFAENVPYFDASNAAVKKMWYYRWWIVRFHLVEAETADLSGYAFYEGKLGFDNVIGFAVPAQLKELTYLRDPAFGLSQARNSYRNRAPNGAVVDPPGSPYWGETYSHWIAMALAEFHRVHPLPTSTIRELLPAMAADVRAWLTAYDADRDGLPERDRPRVTGYDLDILSYWYFNGTKLDQQVEPPALERVDFASFVYANATAVAEFAAAAGDDDLRREFTDAAARIRAAALAHLWDDRSQFFYPQRAPDDVRSPIRELHGFFPFAMGLAPDDPRYTPALAKFVDPTEFWARFPPVITSTSHYRTWTWEMDGLTRNIAPHPISMGARTLIHALKHYRQSVVTADHFLDLLERYTDLMYPHVHPGDPLWRPNAHEYYSKWEPYALSPRPKPSDISHDFHSMYCALIVEGAVGLTPRSDALIELRPLARRWTHFLLDRLRYRGHDLTIVWDQPDGRVRYRQFPEGFSLYVDGQVAFTRPDLAPVRYDPATATLEVIPAP